MTRKKDIQPTHWIIWEGDEFPRKFHSDSIVFFVEEAIYLKEDVDAKKDLATAVLREGIASSLSEAHRLVEDSWVTRGGLEYIDYGSVELPVFFEIEDPGKYGWDATYVELPYVG